MQDDEGTGCACLLVLLAIGLAVAVVISIAAIVDPFDWMPPVAEIWEEGCRDDPETDRDECALATRFPGFWVHVIVNLAWTIASVVLLLALGGAVGDLRLARGARFDSLKAAREYGEARQAVAGLVTVGALLGGAPMLAAVL